MTAIAELSDEQLERITAAAEAAATRSLDLLRREDLLLPEVWELCELVGLPEVRAEDVAQEIFSHYYLDRARLKALVDAKPSSLRATAGVSSQRVEGAVSTRAMAAMPTTFDDATLSVDGVLATETPIPMYDVERGAVVPEVLIAAGAQFPARGQVPLLDGHSRESVGDVLGSVRDLRIAGDQVQGRIYFASSERKAYQLVRDGHVTDLSAGYVVLERSHVARGKTETVAGRRFTGPVNVVTKWHLREASVVPIGADAIAKFRKVVA